MSNQDIDGGPPPGEAPAAPAAPAGSPEYFEQQLAKEREAKALMRDRLRHTEALAAESHALRARMAQELERVTADRDRLRTAATAASSSTAGPPATAAPAGRSDPPLMTPRAVDWPPRTSEPPPRRSGPWRALAMLGGLAAAVGALAWFTGSLPGERGAVEASVQHDNAASMVAAIPVARPADPVASAVVATAAVPAFPVPSGAVALPPLTLTPDQQLAAAPTAAGPTPAITPTAPTAPTVAAPTPATAPATSPDLSARLRKALDAEGISVPVDVDASTGHVRVADPRSDHAQRDRTDMLIRAVYAGASLPEPQIEHRWVSPRRGETPAPVAAAPPPAALSPAAAYAARHAGTERHKKGAGTTVADAEELRAVLPEGRVTASCRASLSGKAAHRADMTACMKRSCCSTPNRTAEDCRAYDKAYPFTCSAG